MAQPFDINQYFRSERLLEQQLKKENQATSAVIPSPIPRPSAQKRTAKPPVSKDDLECKFNYFCITRIFIKNGEPTATVLYPEGNEVKPWDNPLRGLKPVDVREYYKNAFSRSELFYVDRHVVQAVKKIFHFSPNDIRAEVVEKKKMTEDMKRKAEKMEKQAKRLKPADEHMETGVDCGKEERVDNKVARDEMEGADDRLEREDAEEDKENVPIEDVAGSGKEEKEEGMDGIDQKDEKEEDAVIEKDGNDLLESMLSGVGEQEKNEMRDEEEDEELDLIDNEDEEDEEYLINQHDDVEDVAERMGMDSGAGQKGNERRDEEEYPQGLGDDEEVEKTEEGQDEGDEDEAMASSALVKEEQDKSLGEEAMEEINEDTDDKMEVEEEAVNGGAEDEGEKENAHARGAAKEKDDCSIGQRPKRTLPAVNYVELPEPKPLFPRKSLKCKCCYAHKEAKENQKNKVKLGKSPTIVGEDGQPIDGLIAATDAEENDILAAYDGFFGTYKDLRRNHPSETHYMSHQVIHNGKVVREIHVDGHPTKALGRGKKLEGLASMSNHDPLRPNCMMKPIWRGKRCTGDCTPTFFLVALMPIKEGEELRWRYGKKFNRKRCYICRGKGKNCKECSQYDFLLYCPPVEEE